MNGPTPPPGWQPELRTLWEAIMATQAQIDQYAAAVSGYATSVEQATTAIRADIQAIKDANPAVDTAGLEASLARLGTAADGLKALDTENPPATP